MLQAELKGKLSPSRAPHERMEDVLTSYVFSLFRYLEDPLAPTEFLRRAHSLAGVPLDLAPLESAAVFFWPRFLLKDGRAREADVLMCLTQMGAPPLGVVVEAKYESGLSNIADPGAETGANVEAEAGTAGQLLRNQLADEYCGIKCGTWGAEIQRQLAGCRQKVLLYVTGDYVLPHAELAEAIKDIAGRRCDQAKDCAAEAERNIFWLSWRALHALLTEDRLWETYRSAGKRLLEDVRSVLELRNLAAFTPFRSLVPIAEYRRLWRLWCGLSPTEEYAPVWGS